MLELKIEVLSGMNTMLRESKALVRSLTCYVPC